jgi:hypothetical protein
MIPPWLNKRLERRLEDEEDTLPTLRREGDKLLELRRARRIEPVLPNPMTRLSFWYEEADSGEISRSLL